MMTMTMEPMTELPLDTVAAVRCAGAIGDGDLALCRQRERRMHDEVTAALEALKTWDWYDYEVGELLDWMEDHWPDGVDASDCDDAAEEIRRQVMDNYIVGGISVDYARLGWALDAYGTAIGNLGRAEKREADRLGMVWVKRRW